jgi:hypothetical protein
VGTVNTDAIMEILQDGIKRGGTVAVGYGTTGSQLGDDKHPLLSAEIRPDGLIDARTDNDRHVLDPDRVIVAWCIDRGADDQTGQYT